MKHLLRCILIALIVLASTSVFFTGCGNSQPVTIPPSSISTPVDLPPVPPTESPKHPDYFMSHWIGGDEIYEHREEITKRVLEGYKATGERFQNIFDIYESASGSKFILSGLNLLPLEKDGTLSEFNWKRLRMPGTGDAIYKYDSDAEYNALMNNLLNFQSRIATSKVMQPSNTTERSANRETLSGRLETLNPREFYYVNNLPTEMTVGEGYVNLIELQKYAPFTYEIAEQSIGHIILKLYVGDTYRNYEFIADTQGDSSKVHTLEISNGPDKTDLVIIRTDGYNIRFMQDMYLNIDIPTLQTLIGFDVEVYEDLGIANIVTDEFDLCADYRMKQMVQTKKINIVPITTKPVTEEAKEIIEKQKEKGGNATYKDLADLAEHLFGPQRNTTPVDNKDSASIQVLDEKTKAEALDGKYITKETTEEINKEFAKMQGN